MIQNQFPGRECQKVRLLTCSRLLSSGSLLGLSSPHFQRRPCTLLFLQEGHLQALQDQEPGQLQELPARKGKASSEQGGGGATPGISRALPLLLGQDQPWQSSPPLSQMEKTQLLSSGPRKEEPLPREAPRLQIQPRLTGAGARSMS